MEDRTRVREELLEKGYVQMFPNKAFKYCLESPSGRTKVVLSPKLAHISQLGDQRPTRYTLGHFLRLFEEGRVCNLVAPADTAPETPTSTENPSPTPYRTSKPLPERSWVEYGGLGRTDEAPDPWFRHLPRRKPVATVTRRDLDPPEEEVGLSGSTNSGGGDALVRVRSGMARCTFRPALCSLENSEEKPLTGHFALWQDALRQMYLWQRLTFREEGSYESLSRVAYLGATATV